MVTIREVAAEAGVSVATVSRVLSGQDNVSKRTSARVMAAAEKLHYQPNLLGKHLRLSRTNIVLVMLTSLANTFCGKVIHGIEKAAEQNGYHIMVCVTDAHREREETYMSLVRNKLADGMIILNSERTEEEMAAFSAAVPVVQCCEVADPRTTPYVCIDDRQAAYDAADYLIKMGRRRIAFYTADNDYSSSRLRLEGYRDALAANGIPFREELILKGNYGYRNGILITDQFLADGGQMDGVLAISDRMAAGAVVSLKKNGLRVPEDVAVIGFDNTDISYISRPSVSTVSQPQSQLGRKAFSLLLERMKGEEVESTLCKHQLVLRESTGETE